MPLKTETSRLLWPAVAAALTLAGAATPAAAKVSASLHQNSATSNRPLGDIPDGAVIDLSVPFAEGAYHGVTIEALSRLTTSEILFKNSVIGAGYGTSVMATIGVEITVENVYDRAFTPVLKTKLLAAGMGMFLSTMDWSRFYNQQFDNPTETVTYDVDGPSALACMGGQLKNCGPLSDSALDNDVADVGGLAGLAGGESVASFFGESNAGFIFDVSVGGVEAYRLTSTLSTNVDGEFSQTFSNEYGAANDVLNNFREVSAPGSLYSRAFQWDDTDVDIVFPSVLGIGESVTAVYTITTFVNMGDNGGAVGWATYQYDPELGYTVPIVNRALTAIGYAAFADPIGNNGTIDEFSASSFLGDVLSLASFSEGLPGGINTNGTGILDIGNIGFDAETGEIQLNAYTTAPAADFEPYGPFLPPGESPDPVPEPSTWAMLIMGFGFVGAALRRRKAVIA